MSYEPIGNADLVQRVAPDDLAVEQVAELVHRSRRPLIVVGRGGTSADARDTIIGLGAQSGALLATTMPAKGFFLDDPWQIGISGGYSSELEQT